MKTKKSDMVLGYLGLGIHKGDNTFPFNTLFKHSVSLNKKGAFDLVDAIVIWGGTDIHPSMYKQKVHPKSECPKSSIVASNRDLVEWHAMREAHERQIPIIGVCRGAQMLCVFSGGSLYQDVGGHHHYHQIQTENGQVFEAPANHHQMMNLDGTNYKLLAWPYKWNMGAQSPEFTLSPHYDREEEGLSKPGAHLAADKKEAEIVWFPQTKGLAIQPHPEWVPPNVAEINPFLVWLLPEVEKLVC